MLEELRIRSLGVIEESVLELGPGLTVITGETGAGKTMVVTALGLLLGGRADAGAVRTGAPAARVEGVIRLGAEPQWAGLRETVDEVGGQVEDDRLLLARQVAAEGRSRAWVGGASVPVSALAQLADPLVAVHGQSDQHRLLLPATQRAALDLHGGAALAEVLADHRAVYDRLRQAESELAALRAHVRERAREAEMLRLGLEEIEGLDPQPGEDVALATEESRLGHADELRAAAEGAREALSSETDAPDALGAVAAARRLLDSVADADPQVEALAARLAEVSYLLADVAADVASYSMSVETDPARLAAVSERRAALSGLQRKYGETLADVVEWGRRAAERLVGLDGTDDRIIELESEVAELRTQAARLAVRLSDLRTAAAADLAQRVSAELARLAMPRARLSIEVRQMEVSTSSTGDSDGLECGGRVLRHGPHGVDEVEILLAANAGAAPRPLAKGASGGELSRVMLALEVSLADAQPVPTFVFDEVDAGVGGRAAIEIGRRLAALARHAQVIVVTHLPQVAAFADRHAVVSKDDDGLVTRSGLALLDDEGRVKELSRMLAGMDESDTAIAHAEELLQSARGDLAESPPTR